MSLDIEWITGYKYLCISGHRTDCTTNHRTGFLDAVDKLNCQTLLKLKLNKEKRNTKSKRRA